MLRVKKTAIKIFYRKGAISVGTALHARHDAITDRARSNLEAVSNAIMMGSMDSI